MSNIHCVNFEVYTCRTYDAVIIPMNTCSSLFNEVKCCLFHGERMLPFLMELINRNYVFHQMNRLLTFRYFRSRRCADVTKFLR